MSDDEHSGEEGAGMELFWLGNLDEGNKLDVDYLDEDAREHLAGLTKIDLGLQLADLTAAEARGDAPVDVAERAADAQDFADEDEFIEDLSHPAPPTAGFAAVGAALAGGIAAEEEDYDFDEDTAPAPAPQQPPAPPQPAPRPAVPAAPSGPVLPLQQADLARSKGVKLPVVGRSGTGEAFLAFTDLFRALGKAEERAEVRVVPERRPAGSGAPAVDTDQDWAFLKAGPDALQALAVELRPREVEKELGTEEKEQRPAAAREQQQQKAADVTPSLEATAPSTAAAAEAAPQQQQKQPEAGETTPAAPAVAPAQQTQQPAPTAAGVTFCELPDIVFDPVIQRSWESSVLRLLGDAAHDGTSEHESDTEMELEEAEGGGEDDAEMEQAMEAAETGEDGGAEGENEEEEEDDEAKAAREARQRAAAEVAAARERQLEAWGAAVVVEDRETALPVGAAMTSAALLRYPRLEELAAAEAAAVAAGHPAHTDERLLPLEPVVLASGGATAMGELPTTLSGVAAKLRAAPLMLDLNDRRMIVQDASSRKGPADKRLKEILQRAPAAVMPYQKPAAAAPRGVDAGVDEAELELAKMNISRDHDYFAAPKRRAGSGGVRAVHHAKLATVLGTAPLSLDISEMRSWHRPRGNWWPLQQPAAISLGGGRGGQGARVVLISSLVGTYRRAVGDFNHMTPASVWQWRKSTKDVTPPAFLLPGRPPRELPGNVPLAASGVPLPGSKTVRLTAAYRDVLFSNTAQLETIDEEANLRPPNAFAQKSELRASNRGKVLLVEYLQECPLLLNRPGMGVRLATYYRRKGPGDNAYKELLDAANAAKQRWRVGAVYPIAVDDESPFLGELEPGRAQMSVETGLFTAPAAPHAVAPTDFLLTRSEVGVMRLREVTGAVTSGQQLPLHRIPVPGSRDVKDLEERRIYVYVFRFLRDFPGTTVSLRALRGLFPRRPETTMRLFLREGCGLVLSHKDRNVGGDEFYTIKDGARLPSELELRRKFTPEDACVTEASRIAEARLMLAGMYKAEFFNYGNVAADKLRLAAEMLPNDADTKNAAKAVESLLLTAAWNLTDAFMSSFREGRATMRLLGPGDPTGRGAGYSFIRDVRHKGAGADDPARALTKARSGKVQGTDADLRRMTTEQAKQKLMDFGLEEAEIDGLGRWVRIDLVRQLANASAADGSIGGVAKYVRHQKTTLIELQKRYREQAQLIFMRQTAVLNDTAGEELGDQEALEAELEEELAKEEREEGEEEAAAARKKGKKAAQREASPTPEDEARQLEEMRAAGLLGSDGAGPSAAATAATATAAARAEAAAAGITGPLIPGQTRRIRREVLRRRGDGSYEKVKEVIYAGRDRPHMLASLYQKEGAVMTGPWGFGQRTIAAAKAHARLSYAAARGRGMSRGGRGAGRGRGGAGRGGSGLGRGRGRGRGSRGGRGGGVGWDADLSIMPAARASKRERKTRFDTEDIADVSEGSDEEYIDLGEEEGEDEDYNVENDLAVELGLAEPAAKKPKAPKVPRAPKPPLAEGEAPPAPKPKKPKKPKEPKPPPPPREPTRAPSPEFISDFGLSDDEEEGAVVGGAGGVGAESPPSGDEWNPASEHPGGLASFEDPEFVLDDEEEDMGPKRRSGGAARRARKESGGGGMRSGGGGRAAAKRSRPSRRGRGNEQWDDLTDEDEDEDEDWEKSKRGGGGGAGGGGSKRARTSAGGGGGGGLKALGNVFAAILDELRKDGEALKKSNKDALTYWHVFEHQVIPKYVKDYNVWVPKANEMWLIKIKGKANAGKYASENDFMADIRQIAVNAVAYNTPGHGAVAFPYCIELANGLVDYVQAKLSSEKYRQKIEAVAADAFGGGGSGFYYAAEPAAPVAVVPAQPVPEFDLFGSYGAEPVAAAPAEELWAMCDKCKAWRTVDSPPVENAPWECAMKPGFSCATPLEPGASYEK